VTVAERDELLDAVECVERELEEHPPPGVLGPPHNALLVALADLVARTVRVVVLTTPAS
jgi:hypothetical protein